MLISVIYYRFNCNLNVCESNVLKFMSFSLFFMVQNSAEPHALLKRHRSFRKIMIRDAIFKPSFTLRFQNVLENTFAKRTCFPFFFDDSGLEIIGEMHAF